MPRRKKISLADPDFDEEGKPLPKQYNTIVLKPVFGYGIAFEEENFIVFREDEKIQYFEGYFSSIDNALQHLFQLAIKSGVLENRPKKGYDLDGLIAQIEYINEKFIEIVNSWIDKK